MLHRLASILGYIFGAHYLPHASICGAIVLKNVTTAQLGFNTAEVGISARRLSARYFPEFKVKFPNHQNQTTGFGTTDKLSREVELEGAVIGATGRMAATHTTASVLANDVDDFGDGSGGLYRDEATVETTFDGWKMLSEKLTSDPECA